MGSVETQNLLHETNPLELISPGAANPQPQSNPVDNVHNIISAGRITALSIATTSAAANGGNEIGRNDVAVVVGQPDTGTCHNDADKESFIIKLDPDFVTQIQQLCVPILPIDEPQHSGRISSGSTCNDPALQGGFKQVGEAPPSYRDNADVKPSVQLLNASISSNTSSLDWSLFQKDLLTLQQNATNVARLKELEEKLREVTEQYEREKQKHVEALSMLNAEVKRIVNRMKEVAPPGSDRDEAVLNSEIDAQLDEIEERINELETKTMTTLNGIKNNRLEILERINQNKTMLSSLFENIVLCYKPQESVSDIGNLDDINTQRNDAMETNQDGEASHTPPHFTGNNGKSKKISSTSEKDSLEQNVSAADSRNNPSAPANVHKRDQAKPGFVCSCGKAFLKRISLSNHLSAYNKQAHILCEYCKEKFTSHTVLNEHIFKEHKIRVDKRYMCYKCNTRFQERRELVQHQFQMRSTCGRRT